MIIRKFSLLTLVFILGLSPLVGYAQGMPQCNMPGGDCPMMHCQKMANMASQPGYSSDHRMTCCEGGPVAASSSESVPAPEKKGAVSSMDLDQSSVGHAVVSGQDNSISKNQSNDTPRQDKPLYEKNNNLRI